MKKAFILCFGFVMLQMPCFAGDFIVEFVEENYRETQSRSSNSQMIYHSIQVRSQAGQKLLVLTGDDSHYRKWLRQYIAQGKAFIVKVPNDENDLFIKSYVFEIDVAHLHPVNLRLYRQGEEKNRGRPRPNELRKDRYKASQKKRIDPKSGQEPDKKKIPKDSMAEKKKQEAEARKKAGQTKDQTKEAQKESLEKEKQLKARAEQRAAEEQELIQDLERIKKEQTALAEQKADDEKQRREELEQRWQELKQRLLEDDRIRGLDQEVRRREIERRWQELKHRLQLE